MVVAANKEAVKPCIEGLCRYITELNKAGTLSVTPEDLMLINDLKEMRLWNRREPVQLSGKLYHEVVHLQNFPGITVMTYYMAAKRDDGSIGLAQNDELDYPARVIVEKPDGTILGRMTMTAKAGEEFSRARIRSEIPELKMRLTKVCSCSFDISVIYHGEHLRYLRNISVVLSAQYSNMPTAFKPTEFMAKVQDQIEEEFAKFTVKLPSNSHAAVDPSLNSHLRGGNGNTAGLLP